MTSRGAPIRIVGGGMTGLTLGYRLAGRGHTVCVHERDPYLGGLAAETTLEGVPVERFYHCVLPADVRLLALLKELGLLPAVRWTRARTGFFHAGRLLEMTTTADLLRFPAISFLDRIRLGWTVAWCAARRDARALDREPISPFLIRHGGRRLFESIWEPLLLAKLGPAYDRFSASFIWATISRLLSARKARGRSEMLGYISGRYGKVFAALRRSIEEHGGSVSAGSAVDGLRPPPGDARHPWILRAGGEELQASSVILCVPAPVATQFLVEARLPAPPSLAATEYLGVVCETLLLRRSLTPYYVLNLADRGLPFTGVIEFSNLTGPEEFNGRTVVYLPRYCEQDSPLWSRSDEEIHRENLKGLRAVINGWTEADLLGWQVNRARYTQPVQSVGRGDRLPPVRLADGLAYVSTAQIHPWTVFNDEVIRHIDAALDGVLEVIR